MASSLPQTKHEAETLPDAWDYKGRPARRSSSGGWASAAMILGVECCERLTTLGIAVNLLTYLTRTMHLGNAASANTVTNFLGTSFMLCLLGGFIADTYLGSPVSPITNVLPLTLVLLVSLIKEAWEDWKRFQNDMSINNSNVEVLQDWNWVPTPWKKLQVGDIIRVNQDGFFPADLLFLASTNPDGVCYVETANLDGETNLKIRKALERTWDFVAPDKVSEFKGEVQCEQPNNSLYTFTGNLIIDKQILPLSPNQLLLRGCSLRNTEYIVGAVIFTGHETKVMMNSMKIPSKRSTLEKKLDKLILALFTVLFCMCLLGSIGSGIFINRKYYYLRFDRTEAQFDPDSRFVTAMEIDEATPPRKMKIERKLTKKATTSARTQKEETSSNSTNSTSHPADSHPRQSEDEMDDPGSPFNVSKMLSKSFYSVSEKKRHAIFANRNLKCERSIDHVSFRKYGMDVFLKERGLWRSVNVARDFEHAVITEFYANIPAELGLEWKNKYGKVFVRGKVYDFSPEVINKFFGLPNEDFEVSSHELDEVITILSGGTVREWTHKLSPTKLSYKYAVLHKLLCYIWMPTTNTSALTVDQAIFMYKLGTDKPFSYGKIVFETVIKAATKTAGSNTLPYPCLIFSILTDQGYKGNKKIFVSDKSTFGITRQLLTDSRVEDLPYVKNVPLGDESSARQSASFGSVRAQPSNVTPPVIPLPDIFNIPVQQLVTLLGTLDTLLKNFKFHTLKLQEARDGLNGLLSTQKGGDDADAEYLLKKLGEATTSQRVPRGKCRSCVCGSREARG